MFDDETWTHDDNRRDQLLWRIYARARRSPRSYRSRMLKRMDRRPAVSRWEMTRQISTEKPAW